MNSKIKIEWVDSLPPAKTNWQKIATSLKERPGQWARVSGSYSYGTVYHLRGRYGLEAEARMHPSPRSRSARYEIYVRWPNQDETANQFPNESEVTR
jgi:hypothetical protein